jgi:galactose mutarotase-like enzyme
MTSTHTKPRRAAATSAPLVLRAGSTSAVVLPDVGMTVVSLRHRDCEVVALPGGVRRLRQGYTTGVPLLAPWANRLHAFAFDVAGRAVDVRGPRTRTDDQGLPIHGFLVGADGWHVVDRPGDGEVTAARDVAEAGFPFPHRLEVQLVLDEGCLTVRTAVVADRGSPVPVALGWHPYLTLPGPRPSWRLSLPEREHVLLDHLGLPTGQVRHEAAEEAALGRRHFDDLYDVGEGARLGLASANGADSADSADSAMGPRVTLELVEGYRYAQVWVPPRRRYAALEPMSVPTDALTRDAAPMVAAGGRLDLVFSLLL